MRICIILGAGASYANGSHFRPVRQQQTLPPLDYTFFGKISDLQIPIPTELWTYATALPTGNPFREGGRMEEFLRDLFHDFLSQSDDPNAPTVKAYRQLIEMYAGVLRRTTDWMRQAGYTGGPVGRFIAAAADVADHVDVITFNHDLVIENEIFKRARLRKRWCIHRSYGKFAAGRTFLTTAGQPLFPAHDDAVCDHSHPIVIHKMHGSLNWYIRTRGRNPTPGILTGRVQTPDVMISDERCVREIRHVQMRPTGAGRRRWYVWPVIVPPIYAKQSLIQSFMPSVWSDARTALEACDRMVFLGYSLPPADIEAEKLFQRAAKNNDALPWVGVVDPSTAVISRFANLMPTIPLRRYPSAGSFLTADAFG